MVFAYHSQIKGNILLYAVCFKNFINILQSFYSQNGVFVVCIIESFC